MYAAILRGKGLSLMSSRRDRAKIMYHKGVEMSICTSKSQAKAHLKSSRLSLHKCCCVGNRPERINVASTRRHVGSQLRHSHVRCMTCIIFPYDHKDFHSKAKTCIQNGAGDEYTFRSTSQPPYAKGHLPAYGPLHQKSRTCQEALSDEDPLYQKGLQR